jgi:hypothetical protein
MEYGSTPSKTSTRAGFNVGSGDLPLSQNSEVLLSPHSME